MSAEHSNGVRESKILGAPMYSSVREVPICRGNSQICKFISCTAHNFKYDQNLSNLNLAAQLINDKDMRKMISQNPEAITTVCHEQGLSTEQCRLFSRAFQLIDRFMTSIQKPGSSSVVGPTEGGSGDGNADDDDDGIIGSAARKAQRGNAVAVAAAPSSLNTLVLDDDGIGGSTKSAPEYSYGNFFGGRGTNKIVADTTPDAKWRMTSGESTSDDYSVGSDDWLAPHRTTKAPRTTKPSSKSDGNPKPQPMIGGSRTWSTHVSSNKNLYHEMDRVVGRQYGRDPYPGPLARPAAPLRQNTMRINTNAQFVTFSPTNNIKNGGLTKSRPLTAPRAPPLASPTRPAPHAVPPRLSTAKQRTITVAATTCQTTIVAPISTRPYDVKRQNKSLDHQLKELIDFNADYIPEAEDDPEEQSRDAIQPRRRVTRAEPSIITANVDYYDDLKSAAGNKENEGGDIKAPPPTHVRQNCFQYLG